MAARKNGHQVATSMRFRPFNISIIVASILFALTMASVGASIYLYRIAEQEHWTTNQEDIFVHLSQYQHEIFQTKTYLTLLMAQPDNRATRREFQKWFDIVWGRSDGLTRGIVGKKLLDLGLDISKVRSDINNIDKIMIENSTLSKDNLNQIFLHLNNLTEYTQRFIVQADRNRSQEKNAERLRTLGYLRFAVVFNFLTFFFGTISVFLIFRKNKLLKKLQFELEDRVQKRTEELEEKRNNLAIEIEVRRKAEMELRESRNRIEHADRSKTQFLANMSHELRTPLNAIIGFSDIMNMEMLGPIENPKYKGYLEDIVQSGKHLSALLKNILDLSKIEAQEMEIAPERLDLRSAIENSLTLLSGELYKKKHRIINNVKDPVWVYYDPTHLQQILLNLISNAVKYTPNQGEISIEIEKDETRNQVAIHVVDNGNGIPEDKIEYILQPFQRLSDSTTSSESGTGIGLSISAQLARLHGGEIQIKSDLLTGTVASLKILLRDA